MNLYSKPFARQLREAGTFPRRKWKRSLSLRSFRWVIPAGIAVAPMSPTEACIGLAVWTLWLTFWRAGSLQVSLQGDAPLLCLPVSNVMVRRLVRRRVLLASLWLLLDAAAFLSHGITEEGVGRGLLGILMGAPLVWVTGLAGAVALVRWFPGAPFWMVMMGGALPWVVACFAVKSAAFKAIAMSVGASLLAATPAGWAAGFAFWITGSFSFHESVRQATMAVAGLSFLLGFAPFWAREVYYRLDFWGTEDKSEHDENEETPVDFDLPAHAGNVAETFERLLVEDERVESGWIERLALGRLIPRERMLALRVIYQSPRWSQQFWKWVCALLLLPGVMWASAQWFPKLPWWIFGLTMLFALFGLTPFMGVGTSVGATTWIGLLKIDPLSTFPVSVRELRDLIWKVHFVRYLVALPWFFWFSAIFMVGTGAPAPLEASLLPAVAYWLMFLALEPFWFTYNILSPTTANVWGITMGVVIPMAVLIVLVVGSVAVGSWLVSLSGCAGIALLTWASQVFYLRRYNRMRFDLMVRDKAQG